MTLGSFSLIPYGLVYMQIFFYGDDLEYGITTELVDVTKSQIEAFSPSFYNYLAHVHVDVGVFAVSLGIAVAALSWFGVRQKMVWAYWSAILAFLLSMVIGIGIHYPFDLVSAKHLYLVYLSTIVFVIGALLAFKSIHKT